MRRHEPYDAFQYLYGRDGETAAFANAICTATPDPQAVDQHIVPKHAANFVEIAHLSSRVRHDRPAAGSRSNRGKSYRGAASRQSFVMKRDVTIGNED